MSIAQADPEPRGSRQGQSYSGIWYHGSPLKLVELHPGSTISQNRRLAEVFSHKPTLVTVSDEGEIKHNGTLPGFLYAVSEQVSDEDVTPHPQTRMAPGQEWLTIRSLRVSLIGQVEVVSEDLLTDEDLVDLEKRIPAG